MAEEASLDAEREPTWDQKVVRLNAALAERGVPYAFGGAIALNYHREPRSTLDIDLPVLSIEDLLICKVLFDRSKDWVDIEAVAKTRRGDLDRPYITGWMDRFLPSDDPRLDRIEAILG